MKSAIGMMSAALLLGGLFGGCGDPQDDGGGSVTGGDTEVTQPLRGSARRRWTPPPRPPQSGPGIGGTPGGTPAPTPTPAASDDVNAAIKAAQTADGRAIPQPAGPNGECPQVLVLLGFWSCPTIDQTCAYSAAGVHHDCRCSRSDGEGNSPAWVCDQ
jgi:hypothetical protein